MQELKELIEEAKKYNNPKDFLNWWDDDGYRKYREQPYEKIISQKQWEKIPYSITEVDKMPNFKARSILRKALQSFLIEIYNEVKNKEAK